jgi:hypothetical protein
MASPTAIISPSPSPAVPRSSPFNDAELHSHSRYGLATVEGYHKDVGLKGWKTQKRTSEDGSGEEEVEDPDAPIDFDQLASSGDLTVIVQYKPLPNQPSQPPTPVKLPPVAAKSPEPPASSWGSWAASFVPAVVTDSVNAVVAAAVPVAPRYVWKGVGLIHQSPEHLFRLFHDQDNQTSWNKALLQARVLRQLKGTRTSITHVISAPVAGGAVSSREFVNTHDWNRTERTDSEGYVHVDYSFAGAGLAEDQHDLPPNPAYVRGLNGPSGFLMRSVRPSPSHAADPNVRWTIFTLTIDTDVKGWIPRQVTDQATPDIIIEYVNNLRQTWKKRVEQNIPLPPMAPDTY